MTLYCKICYSSCDPDSHAWETGHTEFYYVGRTSKDPLEEDKKDD